MKYLSIALLFILVTLNVVAQQEEKNPAKAPVAPTSVQMPLTVRATAEVIAAGSTKTVKGAPFSAEAVSESVQVLADGNKITRNYTTKMFRDAEGRFRREGSSDTNGGSFVTTGSMISVYGFQDAISIFDPVEGVRYSLNPKNKTARRVGFKPFGVGTTVTVNGQSVTTATPLARAQIESGVRQAQVYRRVSPAAPLGGVTVVSPVIGDSKYEANTESLGNRSFDGVEADGTRTVTTIPAGAIGNERPIEIVYERWYSKDLQLIVFSRHYDPRFGEQTYRLTNISRNEPDRTLFVPPADYKIISEQTTNVYTTKPQ